MKKLLLTLTCAASLTAVSAMAATGDFHITNNTDSYGTIKIGFYPCSSVGGSMGIMKPHESHTFSHSLIKTFCGKSCNVEFFASKNCSGKVIGTALVDSKDGLVSYNNNDPEHFTVVGSGFDITFNQISNSFKSWFKNLF